MFNEKFLTLTIFSIASLLLIYRIPKYPIILLSIITFISLILYGEKDSLIITSFIVLLIIFIIYYKKSNNSNNNEYTIQKLDIYNNNDIIYEESELHIEPFANKLERFKNKKYISQNFKNKLNKKDNKKKENMGNVAKYGFFSSEGFQKDMKEYFNSFDKEGLTTRSNTWGETYKKLLLFKDKFIDNF